jgi:hypothetical protein
VPYQYQNLIFTTNVLNFLRSNVKMNISVYLFCVRGQYCVSRSTDRSSNTAAKIDRELRKNLRCEMSKDGWKVQMFLGGQAVTRNLCHTVPKDDVTK